MLHTAALIDGWMTTGQALKRLEPYSDRDYVVVRVRDQLTLHWFSMRKADVIESTHDVERNFGRGIETPIGSALGLKVSQARNVFDQARVSVARLREASGILLNGRQFVGVLAPDPGARESAASGAVQDPIPAGTPSESSGTTEEPDLSPPDPDPSGSEDTKSVASGGTEQQSGSLARSSPGVFGRLAGMINLDKLLRRSGGVGNTTLGGGNASTGDALRELLARALGGRRTRHEPAGSEPDRSSESPATTAGGEGDAGDIRRGGGAIEESAAPDEAEPDVPHSAGFDDEAEGLVPDSGRASDDVVYPKLEAPERVDPGVSFELVVSLTEERPTIDHTTPLDFSPVAERVEFDLQVLVSAAGFTVDGPSLRTFPVTRLDYARSKETFTLTPGDALDSPSIQTIHVQFFYQGNPIGGAYREVAVGAAPGEELLHTGSTGVNMDAELKAPDLTVFIDEANQSGHLSWTVQSPHPIDVALKEPVDIRLGEHNGQSFAMSLLKGIPSKDRRRVLIQTLRGAGREISRVVPKRFWQALEAVWRSLDDGQVPRVLIISVDPYIPWELATLEDPYFNQELLDDKRPSILSAQVIVGRWLALASEDTVAPYPMLPPPVKVNRDTMAVVVGDYLAKNGVRPLPEAVKEGEDLLGAYAGIRLSAVEDEILNLLDNAVESDGERVNISLMHFACHGVFKPDRPDQNGIVLNNNTRFDPTWAAGNSIGSQTHPFVFMNACEVGSAGDSLSGYGGFAGAFINQGFSGFMAPLWAVHDTDAREFALAFYQKTLGGDADKNMTVGEALRELRSNLLKNPDVPASTYVSYILYAHPDLRFELVN